MSGPGLHFLVCPDAELLDRRIRELLPSDSDLERKVHWADDGLPDMFWQDLTVKGLFSTPKAMILRKAHTLKVDVWDRLAEAMRSKPSDVTIFFCLEGEWNRNKASVPAPLAKRAFYKNALKNKLVWQSPGLNDKTIGDFLRNWTAEKGLTLTGNSFKILCDALPLDARAARLELDKLDLAAGDDRQITPDMTQMVTSSREMAFFEFLDVLSSGRDVDRVWKRIMENHRESDSMLFGLIGAMAREARSLWMLANGEESKVRMHPYVKKLKTPLAHRLGFKGIANMLDLALEAELGVKTGERRPEQALDMMVSQLTRLYAPGSRV